MEIHWVAVAAKLQWREEQAKGGGQLARAPFVSSDQRRLLTSGKKQDRLLK